MTKPRPEEPSVQIRTVNVNVAVNVNDSTHEVLTPMPPPEGAREYVPAYTVVAVSPMPRTRPVLERLLALFAAATLVAACGAKTGLEVPDVEAGPDTGLDAADARDVVDVYVPIDPRPVYCRPIRVHTRLGFVVSLRPDTDVLASTGVTWSVDSRPPGDTRSNVETDGSLLGIFTPLTVGEYHLTAVIPTQNAPGGRLTCSIVVIADPPDPECPGYSITEPRSVPIPGGDEVMAYDIVYGAPRTAMGGSTGVILADDVAQRVATLAVEQRTTENLADLPGALAAEGDRAENRVSTALGATAVLVGRTATTHDLHSLRRSTFRVDATTTPGDLRDRALGALTSVGAPGGAPAHTQASQFYIEVVTVLRQDTAHVVFLVAVSPIAAFDDSSMQTASRVNDFANATSLAHVGATLDVRCHAVTATRGVEADFIWLVDTSGSMYDDQERVGDTAERFFRDLRLAGVDFRVGVFQAGHQAPRLEGGGTTSSPPFQWISGNDLNGARQMAWQVTERQYQSSSLDGLRPFRVSGDEEEPVAASIVVVREFDRRAAAGERNPEFLLRPTATVVTFLVTDEPGTNDYSRYFANTSQPAPAPPNTPWGSSSDPNRLVTNISQWFAGRHIVPFGLVPNLPNAACPSISNLPQCVITRSSGAYIPINVQDASAQAQVNAAMTRIVDTVAGAASEFVLPVDPLSGSLRVRVDGRLVPRSRADGFDYEERAHALVFRGASYRPATGQEVRAAYFVWCDGVTPSGC